ncbi:LysE family translocator [Labrys sp. ZIDIC5]|uniref:LysE family translocator n=1 Tax=Labrys sedimenti TaxID=3106036 RepID=UPI002ACAA4A5|nr:LysE family translocator [Labrys sp. ZIDIC5]MDZ5451725.1 LysE family translocator [Labrys sp. ZIDIC5]
MTYTDNLWLFLILLAGIIIVPGMDMLFVLANALTGGRRAGLAATTGIMAGGVCHTLFGTVAVAALSRLVPALATAMIVVGSAYMIWIGIRLLRSSITVGEVETGHAAALARIFGQGLMTCLLNPKAWLFVLAVYPQFLNPRFGPLWPQAVVMGLMTVLLQFAVYGGLALMAARGRDALTSSPALTIWAGRSVGLLLVAIAAFGLAHRLPSL